MTIINYIKLAALGVAILLIIGVSVYIAVQNKRIDALLIENNTLRVSLESAEGAIIFNENTISGLQDQLAQSDNACMKQLEARKIVKSVLKNTQKQPVDMVAVGNAVPLPLLEQHPALLKAKEVIDDEKNLAVVRYLNSIFGLYTVDSL